MSQVISISDFAEKMKVDEKTAMRILNKNKFAKVKVAGIRKPFVNMDKWNKRIA
jgi:hypothetical protein